MKSENKVECVIFDMDGLLVDSEPLWQKSEIKVFKTVDVDLTVDLCRETMGMRIDEVVRYWYKKRPWNGKLQLKEVEQNIIEELKHNIKTEAEALEGVMEVLDFLQKRNIPLALASSSPLTIIETTLNKLGINKLFTVINSAEFEEYGKPHPSVYIRTVKDMKQTTDKCLVFEDSLNGLIAAKAAQIKTVAIPDSTNFQNPKFSIADVKLPSLKHFNDDIWSQLNR